MTTPTLNNPPLFPGVGVTDLGSTFDTIFVLAALPPGEGRDVVPSANGLFTTYLHVPDAFVIDRSYPVVVDPTNTAFYDVNGAIVPAVQVSFGGIIYIPEPATSMAALATVTFLALRRRGRVRCNCAALFA